MKKQLLLTAAAVITLAGLALPNSAAAQKTKQKSGGAKPAFDKGSSTLGIALGFGSTIGYGSYSSVVQPPAVALIFDHGIVGNVGPGTIGIGGILGFKSAHYNYGSFYGGDYKSTWTNIIAGVRGTYHLTILKDRNNKFDPYAGIMAGLRFESYHDSYYDYNNTNYDNSTIYPVIGAFVGAKYNFKPGFGAFAELGYDIAFFKIGLNFNF